MSRQSHRSTPEIFGQEIAHFRVSMWSQNNLHISIARECDLVRRSVEISIEAIDACKDDVKKRGKPGSGGCINTEWARIFIPTFGGGWRTAICAVC